MRRLKEAGFPKGFVQRVLLPDWWSEECTRDPALLPEIQVRVARFLGIPLSEVQAGRLNLASDEWRDVRLRLRRDVERNHIAPAIHAAIRIADAVVRNLREDVPDPDPPPTDALTWRQHFTGEHEAPELEHIVGDLWGRGIPVVPLETMPSPGFQGLACIVRDRPVILLGYKYDEPVRLAFHVAHEAAHIALGHCAAGRPVVDEEIETASTEEGGPDWEADADRYSLLLLAGTTELPVLSADNPRSLAEVAAREGRALGADPGLLVFAWAHRTDDWPCARSALEALYRHRGARQKLRRSFERHVDIGSASDTDYALLRCVAGGAASDEARS